MEIIIGGAVLWILFAVAISKILGMNDKKFIDIREEDEWRAFQQACEKRTSE